MWLEVVSHVSKLSAFHLVRPLVPSPKHCTSTSFSLLGTYPTNYFLWTNYSTFFDILVYSWKSLHIHGYYSWEIFLGTKLTMCILPALPYMYWAFIKKLLCEHWMVLLLDTGHNLAKAGPRWWYSSRHLKHTHSLWNPLGHSLGWVLQTMRRGHKWLTLT